MDTARFERLSRQVAGASSRREALRALAGAIAATSLGIGLGAGAASASTGEEGVPIISCKVPGQICQGDRACCSGQCKQGICTCFRRGHACWQPGEGAFCCSGRCRAGKCK